MPLHGRSDRRRLLLLLPFAPRLDAMHGGSRAMAQLVAELANRHEVALLYLRAADEPPIDPVLQERCALVEEVARPGLRHSAVKRRLYALRLWTSLLRGRPAWAVEWSVPTYWRRVRALARTWRPDLVQIEYHIMGQYLGALADCSAPRVLTQYDPGAKTAHELWKAGEAPGRVMPFLNMFAWERFERAIMRGVQAVIVFTERDRQALAPLSGRTPIVQIPLGTVTSERPLNPLGGMPPNLLFIGNFKHTPNIDAAMRLASTIFPQLRTQHPELRLYIVGKDPPLQVRQMADERVIVTGQVPDVTPYLDRATLVVVPLRLGGGMRVKVLEALTASKPVVASPLAAEGLDLVSGEQIILAESDQEFCDAIDQLLANPDRRAALATQARTCALANLGWEKSVAVYEQLYDALIDHPKEQHSVMYPSIL